MRAVVQRVLEAKVVVDGETVAQIDKGLLALAAFSDDDNEDTIKYTMDKIINLRIFEDSNEKMNLSINDVGGSLVVVPNFTVYGDVRKGRRPSFIMSANPDKARALFEQTVSITKSIFDKAQFGIFQADMKVHLINDGPVTVLVDSDRII